MSRAAWAALGAGLLFVGVAIHEWSYKADHPYAYGPAVVITVAALAGALLAGAVAYLAFLLHTERVDAQRQAMRAYLENDE